MQRIGIVIGGIVVALVGFVVVVAACWCYFLQHSAFYAACLRFARTHPQILETIGEVQTFSAFPVGFYQESHEEQSGGGGVSLTLHGSKGKATLRLGGYRRFAHWVIDTARLRFDGRARRLDTAGTLLRGTEELTGEALRDRMERALAIQPDLPEPHYLLGNDALEHRNYLRAERAFRDAIALDPSYGPGYNDLGVALMRQERYEDALAIFRQATTIVPEDPYPYLNQAMIHIEVKTLRDLGLSRTLLETAAVRDPDPVRWQELFADLNEAEGNLGEAAAARTRAQQLREALDPKASPVSPPQ